jgi:hypothetical protein
MTAAAGDGMSVRIEGPAPAMAVALDLAKRGLWLLPIALIVSAAFWGLPGVASTAYGMAIVIVNFVLAAYLLAVGGRISAVAMGAFALFGFLMRLGLIFIAVLLVKDADWVRLVPLGLTLIVTHLVLLFWELRHVSSQLAFPGLTPAKGQIPNPHLPSSSPATASPSTSSDRSAER